MKKILLFTIASLFIVTSIQAATPRELIVSGNTLWSQGKFSEAEAEFRQALKQKPGFSAAHERLANLYLTQNKTSEAIEEFQNAITQDSENANLFIGIAIAYLHKKYYQMADAMVNHAIELNPDLANAQKLKKYIDAKTDIIEQANAASVSTEDAIKNDPHASMGHSSPPATVKKRLDK